MSERKTVTVRYGVDNWLTVRRATGRWDVFAGVPSGCTGLGMKAHWSAQERGFEAHLLLVRLAVIWTRYDAFEIDNEYFI